MPLHGEPYYRADLALVHDRGFARHSELCSPGIITLLEPIRERAGSVLEIGCGSGLLTRFLVAAGHRVIATDASPAMLDLARAAVPAAAAIQQLILPDDPIPEADAIVGTGHALNYLDTEVEIMRALAALAGALRPGGVLAIDLCDLEWGRARREAPDLVRVSDEWALFSRFSVPEPERFVREMTTFVRTADGAWRRDDERHDNVLIDTARVPGLLAEHGVEAEVRTAFGVEVLPAGLMAVVGRRR